MVFAPIQRNMHRTRNVIKTCFCPSEPWMTSVRALKSCSTTEPLSSNPQQTRRRARLWRMEAATIVSTPVTLSSLQSFGATFPEESCFIIQCDYYFHGF